MVSSNRDSIDKFIVAFIIASRLDFLSEVYNNMVPLLAENSQLLKIISNKKRKRDYSYSCDDQTYNASFYPFLPDNNHHTILWYAVDTSNADVACMFTQHPELTEFELKDNLIEQRSLLILAVKRIDHKNGPTILWHVIKNLKSKLPEQQIALMHLLEKQYYQEAKFLYFEKIATALKTKVNKQSFLDFLVKNDGQALFLIAKTGDPLFFGNVIKHYPNNQVNSIKQDNKTVWHLFSESYPCINSNETCTQVSAYIGSGNSSYVFKGEMTNKKAPVGCKNLYRPR